MIKDHKHSCTSQFWAEVIMVITSLTILIIMLWQIIQFVIWFIIRIRKGNVIISDQNASLFLSLAHALFLPLMSYMFSQAKQYNQEGRAELILIWMVVIEIIRVHSGHYSTWELWKSSEKLVRLLWVSFLVYSYTALHGIRAILLVPCINSVVFEVGGGYTFYKTKESYLIGKNPTLINNYVKELMLRDDFRTTPMSRCKYIVMGEENHKIGVCSNGCFLGNKKPNTEGILTIGRVFQVNSREDEVLTSEVSNWRDNCLSLALAKMLRRRFHKVPIDEAERKEALDFVLEGLIDYIGHNRDIQTDKNGEKNPIERVFSIIQDELKLVSDFFHIKELTHNYTWGFHLFVVIRIIIMLGIGVYLIIFAISKSSSAWRSLVAQEAYNHCFFHVVKRGPGVVEIFYRLDQVITVLLVLSFMYIEIKSTGMLKSIASKHWLNLELVKSFFKDYSMCSICTYRSRVASTKNKPIYLISKCLARLPKGPKPHTQKAKDFSSILDAEGKKIMFCIKVDVSTLAHLSKWIRRKIPRSPPTIVHSTDAKETILRYFKNCGGQLSNGETTLKNYAMEHLNWACQPNGSTTEAILIWHIATTLLFDNQEPSPQQNNVPHQESASQQKKEREVALALSNYCHYLVMYFPELLPDEVDWTEKMYVRARKEMLLLPTAMPFDHKPTKKERCDYVIWALWNESSVVRKGANLAEDLMNFDGSRVSAMLAEFWAEMMLFIAPSDNVEGHEKILDREELITQLWALLTHAGILTRPKTTKHRDHDESESNADSEDISVICTD